MEEAVKWLQQAADQGYEWAFYQLGKLYLCGKDIPCDRQKAMEYLTTSAEQGNIYAQFLLGSFGFISESLLVSGSDQAVASAGTGIPARCAEVIRGKSESD